MSNRRLSAAVGATLPEVRYETIMCGGGMDQVTPTLDMKAGALRDALNFECSPTGGYTRVAGYERYDGHASPYASSAFAVINISGSTGPANYATITGATSGATGVLINQTASTFILTSTAGSFQANEQLKVGAVVVGTFLSTGYATTALLIATYTANAADYFRSLISAVPGSGAIRGVFVYQDVVYAFRDNVGATQCLLYKATPTGWVNIPYFNTVSFTAGSVAPTEGATITQGSVTATVKRLVLQSGAWAGGTAAGQLIITTPTGGTGNFAAGALTAGGTLTLSGVQTAISQQAGGKYDFDQGNFKGSTSTVRVYGCDGVNKGFEFDGTVFVPIATGATNDAPKFVQIHKNQLLFAIRSSLMQSSPGLPYDFTAINGASEIAVGDIINGMLIQPGAQTTGTMAVFTATDTFMLYGTGISNWNLVHFNTGTGCIPYSAQNMAQSYVFDNHGIISLQTTLNFGNFEQSALTANLLPFVQDKRTKVNASTISREKSQYRLYFSDGYGLTMTIVNGNYMGAIPFFYPVAMNVAWESTLSTGEEVVYCGGADGYVYRMERGTSFDGQAINAYLTFAWDSFKSPRILKRYRRASVEIAGSSYVAFSFGYNVGYRSTEYAAPAFNNYTSNFAPTIWDNFTWDSFTWDGLTLSPSSIELVGTAENMQSMISSNTNLSSSFTINSIIINYTLRRGLRV